MKKTAVIFDIDGLLINSEPLWNKAATEIFRQYGISLTEQQYATTTGLRSKEFVAYWLHQFNVPASQNEIVEKKVVDMARSVFDLSADITIELNQWNKKLSDKVFSTLEDGNKQELTKQLHDLKEYEKELLEIIKKIDTLHI